MKIRMREKGEKERGGEKMTNHNDENFKPLIKWSLLTIGCAILQQPFLIDENKIM